LAIRQPDQKGEGNKMRKEIEITEKIEEVEKNYHHVLTGGFANIQINAPRALMQLTATSILDGLYFALNKPRPLYEFEKRGK